MPPPLGIFTCRTGDGRYSHRQRASSPTTTAGRPRGIVAEVMDKLGMSQARRAEDWIDRKLAGASGPVRNEPAFLRRCLEQELAQREAAAKKPTKGKGGGRPAGKLVRTTPGERLSAVTRIESGAATNDEVAAELGVTESTVKTYLREWRGQKELIYMRWANEPQKAAKTFKLPLAVVKKIIADGRAVAAT